MLNGRIHTLNTHCIVQFIWLPGKTRRDRNLMWPVWEEGIDCKGAQETLGERNVLQPHCGGTWGSGTVSTEIVVGPGEVGWSPL